MPNLHIFNDKKIVQEVKYLIYNKTVRGSGISEKKYKRTIRHIKNQQLPHDWAVFQSGGSLVKYGPGTRADAFLPVLV